MDNDERIELLSRLVAADVQRRLVTEVLATITPEDRARLTAAIVGRAEALVARGDADGEVRRSLADWTAHEVLAVAQARWAVIKGAVEGQVDARLAAYATDDKVTALVDTMAPAAFKKAVTERINSALRELRKATR